MSKVIGFVIGAALIAVGIATGNPYLIIQGGLMIVSNAVLLLTAPKTPARNASEMSIQLGEQPRVMLLGETFTPGSLVDGFNYGGKYKTQWEVLVIRLADHKCHSMTGFYVNDEWNAYTGNGYYPRYGTDNLQVFFRNDTTNQPLPSIVTTNGPGWTSADIGESGCDVVVAYKCDKPDTKHPVWPGGRPRFGFVVKGAYCYDPRLDDTVTGGSGPHRIDDPDTWEWTENAAICRYKWVRGVYANDDSSDPANLLIGRGLTAEEAPPENVFAAANLCDDAACPVFPYAAPSANGYGLDTAQFTTDYRFFIVNGGGTAQIWDVVMRQMVLSFTTSGNAFAGAANGFYALNGFFGQDLIFVGLDGSEHIVVYNVDFPAIMGKVYYLNGNVYMTASLGGNGYSVDVTGVPNSIVNVGTIDFFFAEPRGDVWGVADSGTDLVLTNVTAATSFTVASPTTGAPYAMFNPNGEIVVWQNDTLILIDPVGQTVLSSASATDIDTPEIVFRNVQAGAASVWGERVEYSTTTLAAIRTIDLDDWATAGSISTGLYSPLTNSLISRPLFADEFQFRDLDKHAGYRVAGPVYSNQDFIDVEGMFAAATGGTVVTREGSVELNPGHAESVVATFSDADLLAGAKVSCNRGILSESNEEWLNTVAARYVEPSQKWTDHGAPVVRDTADITIDGKPREVSLALRLVRYQEQALRIAEITRRLGRLWWRGTVTLGPSYCEVEDGDWVTWVSSRFPSGSKTFRVEAYNIDEKWQNTLTLREINANVYDCGTFDPDLSVPSPPPFIPDIGAPDSGDWTLTAITLDSAGASIPALHVEGLLPDDEIADTIIFEYWLDDGSVDPTIYPSGVTWTVYGNLPATTTQVDITSVTGGATYYVAITYVDGGVRGDRLVLGPVTLADYQPTAFFQLEDSFTPLHFEDDATLIHLG